MTERQTTYAAQGFWIERGLLSAQQCEELLAAGMALIEGDDTPNRIMQPHQVASLFLDYLKDRRIVADIEELTDDEVVGTQTMFYIKPPGATGHGWHQDNHYITGRPKPCLAAWCALGAVGAENGGLTVFPGSHRSRRLFPMVAHCDANFGNHERIVEPPAEIPPLLVEMAAGDVLYFDGCLIHGSLPNHSRDDCRPAYIAHYVPVPSLLPETHGVRVPVR